MYLGGFEVVNGTDYYCSASLYPFFVIWLIIKMAVQTSKGFFSRVLALVSDRPLSFSSSWRMNSNLGNDWFRLFHWTYENLTSYSGM